MWFRWIIDAGAPGPDRGEGGKYLIVPPDYDGPLPEGGFYIGRSRTVRALYFGRSFLENDDPKPVVANVKQTLKIYPYTPGGVGTSIATALEGNVKLAVAPPVPPTKFIESSGKSFNTIPPTDYIFYETINALVQEEPATALDPELAGQPASIGIVKGKPFAPDARMKKILTDAVNVANATYGGTHPQFADNNVHRIHRNHPSDVHAINRRRIAILGRHLRCRQGVPSGQCFTPER